ncbi:hypothetical protein FWK35_00015107 [Aphis craccivora]|uniref:Uncharacterized protein n=1 Tax=Aphis craccivora TaxID=307492 RepID=A0A6G0YSC3_APHCR|nr:hypothetical protein FWK35_00015107 [Aphis craccivora]
MKYFYQILQAQRRRPPGKRFSVPWRRSTASVLTITSGDSSEVMASCWVAASVFDRERFPYGTTGNDGYGYGDGDEAAAMLVRADRVVIVMDATGVWPHRVCTALCARTGWCRTDTRVHATTSDKNKGARM